MQPRLDQTEPYFSEVTINSLATRVLAKARLGQLTFNRLVLGTPELIPCPHRNLSLVLPWSHHLPAAYGTERARAVDSPAFSLSVGGVWL